MKNSFINYRKVLIVGLGMIGGSYAEKLSALGFEVGAIVRRREVLDYALERGLIAHGRIEVTREYVSQFDLVISALYPKAFVEWVRKYQDFFKSGAVITDVTGVKRAVVPAVQSILREDVEFVPSHPMAGRERSGVEFADSKVFAGANFIITPTERNTPEGIELVRSLACILGFRHIAVLSPEAHDEMIGFLSQLTHCIAVALMDCKESEHLVEYTGDSFRDLTRIARINENMWTELFLENRDELLKQMDLFLEKFTQLRDALAKGDEDTMKEMMRLSSYRRSFFDKK
ncbi:MAG: prephenate dehydrogenase [Bacteroidales bacterium]|nr:prephenate dehydrogenase [Bacteroidales bacterium]